MSKTIAIVGMGLSGNALFCRLIQLFGTLNGIKEDITIKIYEQNPEYLATGFAYSIDSPNFWTLNNPVEGFKFIENTDSLSEWIGANSDFIRKQYSEIDPKYVPRSLVGYYLRGQYAKHKALAELLGIKIQEVFSSVSDIDHLQEEYYRITCSGASDLVDALFLTTGHLMNNVFQEVEHQSGYVRFERTRNLEQLDIKDEVCVIGGQAAFVDAALWLTLQKGYQGKIHCVTRGPNTLTTKGNADACAKGALNELSEQLKRSSPNGLLFSEARDLFWTTYQKDAKNPLNSSALPGTYETLRYQMNKFDHIEEKNNFPGNVDELRDFIKSFYFGCYSVMWQCLSPEGKDEFIKYFYSLFMAYLTGITPVNARLMLSFYETSRIVEHVGLASVSYDELKQRFDLLFTSGEILHTQTIIDATGYRYTPSVRIEKPQLLDELANRGLVVAKLQGGIVLSDSYQVIDRDGKLHETLFCLGPVAKYNHPVPTPHSSFMVNGDVEKAMDAFTSIVVEWTKQSLSSLMS